MVVVAVMVVAVMVVAHQWERGLPLWQVHSAWHQRMVLAPVTLLVLVMIVGAVGVGVPEVVEMA